MNSSPGQQSKNELGFRLLGVLPLVFFLAQATHYWRLNELGNMLWVCNIGNLLLALGLFLRLPRLIRVAAIWTVPGLMVWIVYVVLPWGLFLSSILAHLGGFTVAMVALRRVGMDRVSWVFALAWYLLVQILSRLFTPVALNVNVAHTADPAWQQTFNSYLSFWVVLALITVLVLAGLNLLFYKLWPREQ